jgi:integron integrase
MKLLDQIRAELRRQHKSDRTETAYVSWILRYIRYHGIRHPKEMGRDEINEFLTWLATDRKVASSTQNQALSAIIFLYRHVLKIEVQGIDAERARRTRRLPSVLSQGEVGRMLAHVSGQTGMVVRLLYGCGMRIGEACELRVQNVELERGAITIRGGKGDKDRVVMLPKTIRPELERHMERRRQIHEQDRAAGGGYAPVPHAFARKSPNAPSTFGWQFLFMARDQIVNRETGRRFRPPIHRTTVQRAVKEAVTKAALTKRVSAHTLRHSFATHMIEAGIDIRTVQKLLGHTNVQTTMIYLHVAEQNFPGITSPLDRMHEAMIVMPPPPGTTPGTGSGPHPGSPPGSAPGLSPGSSSGPGSPPDTPVDPFPGPDSGADF